MKSIILGLLVFMSYSAFSQTEEEEEEDAVESTSEIGIDGYFGASNFGGTFGIGGKYGFKVNENVIFGPSVRIQRSWANYYSDKFGYTIYGGGLWLHARFGNYLFVGGEFEMLNAPTNIIFVSSQKKWVPTLFVGGGFSHQFNKTFRLNAGVFYDIANNVSSPFRTSYFMKKQNGALIPVIYRIGFFFPL